MTLFGLDKIGHSSLGAVVADGAVDPGLTIEVKMKRHGVDVKELVMWVALKHVQVWRSSCWFHVELHRLVVDTQKRPIELQECWIS